MERTVLIFAALYVFAPSVFGQNPTSPVTITAPRPGKVAIYYIAVKDTTTVVLGFSDVGGESPCGLYILPTLLILGKRPLRPTR